MSSILRKVAVSACLTVGYPMMASPPRCLPFSPEAAGGSALCEALESSLYALNRAGGRRDFWFRRPAPLPAPAGPVAKVPPQAAIPTNPDATAGMGGVLRTTVLVEAKVVAGERLMQWSLGGSGASTPKVLVAVPVLGRLMHAGFAEYAQLAPSLYLLSFGNDRTMRPIRARQFTGGIDVLDRRLARINVEAYEKRYSDYPVALHYPELSLANIADTFGQAFLLFPMTSAGHGVARGVEWSLETRPTQSLTFTAAASYSRSWYSGLDGVLRLGNLDLPVVVNLAGQWRLPHGMAMSFRYSGASGRPYTPDNMQLNLPQNREVYDLTRINAIRATSYSRLDLRFERTSMIGQGTLTWHVGLQKH